MDDRQRSYYEEMPRGWLPLPFPRVNYEPKGEVLLADIYLIQTVSQELYKYHLVFLAEATL